MRLKKKDDYLIAGRKREERCDKCRYAACINYGRKIAACTKFNKTKKPSEGF